MLILTTCRSGCPVAESLPDYPTLPVGGGLVGGGSSNTIQSGEWMFNASTAAPPGPGQIRLNSADQKTATRIYISKNTITDIDAANLLKIQLGLGSKLLLQEKDNSAAYAIYELSADGVFVGGAYFDVPVTFVEAGTPIPAQRCFITIA